MSERPSGVAPIIPILDWEGPAINNPAASDVMSDLGLVIELIASGVASAQARAHTLLVGWRKRYGEAGYEALKQRLQVKIAALGLEPAPAEELRARVMRLMEQAGG